MLVGEGRPFLSLLAVTKDGHVDEKELLQRANERLKNFPRYARVRRVVPIAEPWTVENGLITPTLKVRRENVFKKYAAQIEEVYASGPPAKD